jgi:hypothetical protein
MTEEGRIGGGAREGLLGEAEVFFERGHDFLSFARERMVDFPSRSR